jgi:hypothetical protein
MLGTVAATFRAWVLERAPSARREEARARARAEKGEGCDGLYPKARVYLLPV